MRRIEDRFLAWSMMFFIGFVFGVIQGHKNVQAEIEQAEPAITYAHPIEVGSLATQEAKELEIREIQQPKTREIDPLKDCIKDARQIAIAIRQVSATYNHYRCDIANQVYISAVRHGIDPMLVVAVGQVESSWRLNIRGSKGEYGPMQVMPNTAREMGVKNLNDWKETTDAGIAYLAKMLDRAEGNLELALSYYNAGPSRGKDRAMRVAKNYVRKVMQTYNELKR